MKQTGAGVLRSLLRLCGILALTTLCFVVIEGLASVFHAVGKIRGEWRGLIAERAHTEYDPLLGWINQANLHIEDMYGPGLYLRTNAQRFRSDTDTPTQSPKGTRRLVCSGDSFTLGNGVGNAQTWCSLLAGFGKRLETVNMGQGGYGIDQAYLWYQRDGVELEHDVHLLAFITYDFDRMRSDNFVGYGKPVLRWKQGQLAVENVPVPKRSLAFPQLTQNGHLLRELRSVRLGMSLLGRLTGAVDPAPRLSVGDTRAVARAIFDALDRSNAEAGRSFAAVYLPRGRDAENTEADPWRAFLREESDRTGMIFIDLIEDFRLLPEELRQRLFLRQTWDHYTILGNAWVAKTLDRKLRAHPAIAARLGPPSDPDD